jgi:hypothetical protein
MTFTKEITKTISFTMAIQYVGINFTNKNYKTLVKIVEKKTNTGEKEVKENDEEDEFSYDIFIIKTFVNVTIYPQHNNNNKKTKYGLSCS